MVVGLVGLHDCVTADNSDLDLGALHSYAGEVRYEFLLLSYSKSLIVLTAIVTDHQQEKRHKMTSNNITGG